MLSINETRESTVLLLDLCGRLDGITAIDFERRLNESLDQQDYRVVLNCAGLDFISSAGLRVLLSYAKKLQRVNGRLRLAALQPAVCDTFDQAHFFSFIQHHPTVADAIQQVMN